MSEQEQAPEISRVREIDGFRVTVRPWDGQEGLQYEATALQLMSQPFAIALASGGEEWTNPVDSKESMFMQRVHEIMERSGMGVPEWVRTFCANVVVTAKGKNGKEAVRFELDDEDQFAAFFTGKPALKYKIAWFAAEVQLGPLFVELRSNLAGLGQQAITGLVASLGTFVGEAVQSGMQSQQTSPKEAESGSKSSKRVSTKKAKSTSPKRKRQ